MNDEPTPKNLTGSPTQWRSEQNRCGFTMIEVIVASVILALIAGMIAYSVRGRVRNVRLVQAREQIAAIDRVARDLARDSGAGVSLEFDDRDNTIRVVANRKTHKTVKLSVPLGDVRTGRKKLRDDRLVISPLGQSATYAVEFEGDDDSAWLVVSGLSGQPFATNDWEQVDALLRL